MSKKPIDETDLPIESADSKAAADEEVINVPKEDVETVADKSASKPKQGNKISRHRLRMGSTSIAITAIVIVGVLLLNIALSILAEKFPITVDLSEDQIYTMSDSSIAIAKNATVNIEIIIFTSESFIANSTSGAQYEIPEFDTTMKEFYNILKQYDTYSGGKITHRFIDPDQDPALFAQYAEYDIARGSILLLAEDGQYRTMTVDDLYIVDTSNDYSYTFESTVEKTIGSAVNLLCGVEETLIQILVGHDENTDTIDGIRSVYDINGYAFEEHSIIGSSDFSKDAKIMLIAAPASDYSKEEVERIQAWMYNDGNYGRHLMVYIDPMADCPNLYEFLEVEYQIRVEDQIIFENDMSRAYYYNPYYTFADVPETSFSSSSASTGRVIIPQARRLTTILGEKNEESAVTTYGLSLTTHPESAGVTLVDKMDDENATAEEVVLELDDAEYPLSSTIAYISEGYNNTTDEETYSTVVVCGSPYLANATYLQNTSFRNEEFILDLAGSMARSENDIIISTKDLSEESVVFDGNTQLILGLGVFTFGLPAVIIIICLVVFIRRKNL